MRQGNESTSQTRFDLLADSFKEPVKKRRRREERLSAELENKDVTLRNGSKLDVRRAFFLFNVLQALSTNHPELFSAIKNIVIEDRFDGIGKKTLVKLRQCGLIKLSGQPCPGVSEILESCSQDVPEGEIFVHPFAPASASEHKLIESVEKEANTRLLDLFRDIQQEEGR